MTSSTQTTSGVEAAWRRVSSSWHRRRVPAVLALIGAASREVLEAIERHAPDMRVLALEPRPDAGRAFASDPMCQSWRASGRLVYLIGPDYSGRDEAWRIFPRAFEVPALAVDPACALAPETAGAAQVLKAIIVGADANAKARDRFAPQYLVNALRNAPSIIRGSSVHRLAGTCEGRPAIIVGAGPSLDRGYDQLRAAVGRALIVATDTTLRPLLSEGIAPDLVVGLDPSALNARHFLSLPECQHTWLVAEAALDRQATDVFAGRTFWCAASDHQPWPWLCALGAEPALLPVWGSVLTGAYQVAVLAGCDPVIAVGADMAFTDGRPYARGTTYEFDWAWSALFGASPRDTWRSHVTRSDVFEQADVSGRATVTTPALVAFRDWLLAQARKGERRLINASGVGLLHGDGIEQASLGDALDGPFTRPNFRDLARRDAGIRPAAVARAIRNVAESLRRGTTEDGPWPAWREFAGPRFDGASVLAAVEEAAAEFETKGRSRRAATHAVNAVGSSALAALPEQCERFRLLLGGHVAAEDRPSSQAHAADPDPLVAAFDALSEICRETLAGPDFVSWPDPQVADTHAIGGIGMWPEPIRWRVLHVEALLARAWRRVTPVPARPAFATARTIAGPHPTTERGRGDRSRRPFAAHACVALALEWLRAVDGAAEDPGELRPLLERLRALEYVMRDMPLGGQDGPPAELHIDVHHPAGDRRLVLPLGMADQALARLATGAVADPSQPAWILGRASAPWPVVVTLAAGAAVATNPGTRQGTGAGREAGDRPAVRHPLALRTIELGASAGATVFGTSDDEALVVVAFTGRTMCIGPDGRVRPHREWPRPITGALSLGRVGEIAWSNVLTPRADGPRPYLMFRAAGRDEVQHVALPFRPSMGLWWRGRVYFTCQPTPNGAGGIGSWAPGDEPTFEQSDLTLIGLVATEHALLLGPYRRGTGDTVLREPPAHGYRWAPGEPPVASLVGRWGVASSAATRGRWTATAYPQADVIELTSSDGLSWAFRCYYPLRLAWAGPSLVVSTAEREVLLFEALVDE